jgi:formate hydrogenlyase transcriptional activator
MATTLGWKPTPPLRAQGGNNPFSACKFGREGQFDRRAFDGLLVDLSNRFKNSKPQNLDGEIDEGLKKIASYFECDCIALWEFTNPGTKAFLSHCIVEQGTKPPFKKFINDELPHITKQLLQEKTVCAAHVDDLPDSAATDRQGFRRHGIKSFIAAPVFTADIPQGCLSLTTSGAEREWSEEESSQIERICSLLGHVLYRKASFQKLEEGVRFESLLSFASKRFCYLSPEESEEAVSEIFARLLSFFGSHFCGLFEFNPVKGFFPLVHAGHAAGPSSVPAQVDFMQAFPWLYDWVVKQGKPFVMERLDEFSQDAVSDRKTHLAWKTEAFIALPIYSAGSPAYCIFLADSRQRAWPATTVSRLELLAEVIVNGLKRNQADRNLMRSHDVIVSLKARLEAEADPPTFETRGYKGSQRILGRSEAITRVLVQIEQVSSTNSTVFIRGETGTGKELVAEAIHRLSSRTEKPMVMVNCASLPTALVEAELFGREKGAYTGALSKQAGRFEVADGGTIFLDEIGELSTEVQAKLLRVLQEGSFERLGSPNTLKVDVRVIAASNRNLAEEVKKGTFREDLFYRLNVFPIHVPPLRMRVEDIPCLVWSFIEEFSEKMGKKIHNVTKRDMEALQTYSWPGNVRELRNVIEYAVIVSPGDTLKVRLPEPEQSGTARILTLEELEYRHISEVLRTTGWRIKGERGAARLLGMNPSTLYSRMLKLGIVSR